MAPGDVVANRYLLTSLLGEGGMGAVWLARDLKLDIDVALKFIHREVATEATSERLLQEARAVARLDHASIVRVFDFGEAESGEPFMAMEVLRGELLSEVLERKGRLAPPNAVCTLLPVASAVAAAHAKGVVHRDLKPENILLVVSEESGSVIPKVLDFGIAQLRSKGQQKVKRITQNDAIIGTPDYMPPEQASGVGEVDHRADVWALCVVLYEALTAERPFPGETPPMVLIAIATQPPKPITEHGVGDDALWQILERGLQKDADKRFQTMRELGSALARWAVDNGAETDVAGTSLSVHWLAERARRPLSEVPSAPELMLPPAPSGAGSIAATAPAASPRAAADDARRARAAAIEATNAAPRTGATWPPRAVVRAASETSLQSLVERVSLPPELEPARRWRFVYWLMGLAAVGGVVLAFQNPSSVRQVYDVLFGPKREPGASTEATTAPTTTEAPTAREPASHPHGPATGTATAKPGTRPRK